MSHNKSQATTAKNKARLMKLLQDPSNKHCADCKTARNPRWASWNLGLFICIRCSGIHRSLGTHITRVKSVDLDSWTDEQTESMCNWGNKRANAYWEAKLKPRSENEMELGGYVPLEGKVESFVRTKYVLGKWKDDGPRDPSRYSNVNSSSVSQPSTNSQQSQPNVQNNDPLSSLLDLSPHKAEPIQQSVSTSSLLDRPSNINRSQTNPTLSLLEQHSNSVTTTSSHTKNHHHHHHNNQNHHNHQQQQKNNNRPDLKKSILSLYSTPSPAASNVSIGGYPNNTMNRTTSNTGSSSNSTFSSFNTIPNNNINISASNIWNSTTTGNTTTSSKNIVDEDPFKNVWS